MQIDESTEGDAAILTMSGRLDATTAPIAETRLLDAVKRAPSVVLDCSAVDYVSSAGLRIILKGAKAAKAVGARFALAGLQPAVRDVFEISGFLSILKAYPTLAEALAA